MAKQTGPFIIKGTIGGITFYESEGVPLAKAKNRAPSKQRYKTHPSYASLREHGVYLTEAQRHASYLYSSLSKEEKNRKLIWYPLRNKAQELVKAGLDGSKISDQLKEELAKLREQAGRMKKAQPEPDKSSFGVLTVNPCYPCYPSGTIRKHQSGGKR